MKKIAVVAVAGTLGLSGCAYNPLAHHDPIVQGAVYGGVAGGAIGAVATGNLGGLVVGAGIGAAAGATIAAAHLNKPYPKSKLYY